MGGTVSMKMVKMSKEIWNFLFQNGIPITAEYLPGSLNVEADWESRNARAKTSGVQEVVPKVRDTNNRPVCIETFKTNSKLLFLETRPVLPRGGCNATGVASGSNSIRLSSLFSNQQGLEESSEQTDLNTYSDNSSLAISSMVSSVAKPFETKPSFTPSGCGSIKRRNTTRY